jgi:4-amino-4-deoxychorismate lyase
MCQLFESIKIKDGIVFHLDLHQQRMDCSVKAVFGIENNIKISEILSDKKIPSKGLFKCRLSYNEEIQDFQILPYQQKMINSLKLVKCDEIKYNYKYSNRDKLNELLVENKDADEIIIVKNGFITDSSYSNLVFWNGETWHTPSTPLLKGIQREYLISQNKIKAVEIRVQDLEKYQKVGLINDMMDLEDMPIIETKNIKI